MIQRQFIYPIILLQILPIIIFPVSSLTSALAAVGFIVVVFIILGIGMLRGRSWALSLSIFLQGLNIIVRLMMLFPNAMSTDTGWDLSYIAYSVVAMALSGWFLLRLDKPDIRSLIVA